MGNPVKVPLERWIAVAIVMVSCTMSQPVEEYRGDGRTIRAATYFLLRTGAWDVPEAIARPVGEPGQYYVRNPDTGRWFPKYGVLTTLHYAPALAAEMLLDPSAPPLGGPLRVPLMNLQNILTAGLLAALMHALAVALGASERSAAVWVVLSLLGSFAWNYLRAHTTEILLCVLIVTWALASLRADASHRRWRVTALLALGALCLTKIVFVVLLPVTLLWAWRLAAADKDGTARWRRFSIGTVVPLAVIGSAVLWANHVRFGSPWQTGYTVWARETDIMGGSVFAGTAGYLFHPQRSVFLHHPVSLLALLGIPLLLRRNRPAAAFLGVTLGGLWLLNARGINWQGSASYGPRYLLPVLLVACVPAALALQELGTLARAVLRATAVGVLAVVFSLSVWAQVLVNALPFFAYYQVEGIVRPLHDTALDAHLDRVPFALLNAELLAWTDGQPPSPFIQGALAAGGPAVEAALKAVVVSNVTSPLADSLPTDRR